MPEDNAGQCIPGPPQMRFLGSRGNLVQFRRDPIAYLQRLRRHGEIAAFAAGRYGTVFAFGPQYNQQVLSNPALFYSTGLPLPGPSGSAQKRISYSILSMNAEKHARQRKLIAPPFHRQALEGYHHMLVERTEQLLSGWKVGRRIDFAKEMKEFTLGIAGKILFALDDDVEAREIGQMISRWMQVSTTYSVRLFPKDWPGLPYHRMLKLAGQLERKIQSLIARRRAGNVTGNDVLSILIRSQAETDAGLTDEELLGQTTILFAAAHETTANALTWTLFLLAQHPKILGELRDELSGVLQGRAPTGSQLEQLPLLGRVIKESLRILPPVPYATRTSIAPFELGPFLLPAKTTVAYSQYITHRLPELYPEPDRFLPDRWLTIQPSPYEYLPFGAGPRICIGAAFATTTIKIALSTILQRFNLNLLPGTHINRRVTITLSPKNGLPVEIQPLGPSPEFVPVRGNIHEMVQLRAG